MAEQRNKYNNYPRDQVSWYQALAFTRWLDFQYREAGLLPKQLEQTEELRVSKNLRDYSSRDPMGPWAIRLPTEWEWHQAATGGDTSRVYPWGDEWENGQYCNSVHAGVGRATAVGMYPHGNSPVGALDMAGNVLEWCLNDYANLAVYQDYGGSKSLRGGDYTSVSQNVSCSARNGNQPYYRGNNFSFRVVYAATYGYHYA